MNSGFAIKQHRRARGWTQTDLAQRIRVSPSIVSMWETGERRPSPRNRVRLEDALRLPQGSLETETTVGTKMPTAA